MGGRSGNSGSRSKSYSKSRSSSHGSHDSSSKSTKNPSRSQSPSQSYSNASVLGGMSMMAFLLARHRNLKNDERKHTHTNSNSNANNSEQTNNNVIDEAILPEEVEYDFKYKDGVSGEENFEGMRPSDCLIIANELCAARGKVGEDCFVYVYGQCCNGSNIRV